MTCSTNECLSRAKKLAQELQLPFVTTNNKKYSMLLDFIKDRLVLRVNKPHAPNPIYVDFLTGTLAHRQRFGGGSNQLLAKAVGLKVKKHPHIIDATAGLGGDGFILATLGGKVTYIERSPIIAALLRDGMERAQKADWFQKLTLKLIQADAKEYLSNLKKLPDVIYLDPMYPVQKNQHSQKKKCVYYDTWWVMILKHPHFWPLRLIKQNIALL